MKSPRSYSRRSFLRTAAVTGIGAASLGPLAATHVSAQQVGEERTVISEGLRLRSGPGTSYSVVAVLSYGTTVEIRASGSTVADGYTWINVNVPAITGIGWLAAEYVEASSQGGDWSAGIRVWVNAAMLNLRSGPNGSVIDTIPSGTRATTTGSERYAGGLAWVPVILDSGQEGWFAASYLSTSGPAPTVQFPLGTDVYVDTDLLNLRSGPSLSNSVLGLYASGAHAVVIDAPVAADGYTWYKVEVSSDGAIGWFAGSALAKGSGSPAPRTDRIRVTDGPVNLRTAPGLSGSVIRTLPTGEGGDLWSLETPSVDGYTWVKIRADSSQDIGWVAGSFIKYI